MPVNTPKLRSFSLKARLSKPSFESLLRSSSNCAIIIVRPSFPAGSLAVPASLKAKETVVRLVLQSSTKMTGIFFLVWNSWILKLASALKLKINKDINDKANTVNCLNCFILFILYTLALGIYLMISCRYAIFVRHAANRQ